MNQDHAKVLVTDASYDNLRPALDRTIEALDLASWHSSLRGRKVFIKPNMLGLFPPEQHATTHPALVRALVRFFREAGAEVMVGDNCGVGGYGLSERAAKKTGIKEAAEGAYVNVAEDTTLASLRSRFVDRLPVSRAILEAEVLVSVPKMKTHGLTVVTGAVKNMFGMIAGAGKSKAHAAAPGVKDFGEMLADIFALRPPDLTIMDAIAAMEGNGPSSGTPKQLGKILASTNAVALDAVMCRIMGYDPEKVYHLKTASKRGHGPLQEEAIELIGSPPPPARFKLPLTVQRFRFAGRFLNQRIFEPISRVRLVLDKNKCKKCKLCVEACPAGAMSMEGDFPEIDEELCIRCFCCHELCPESAWETKGFFGRLFMRSE